MPQSEANFFQNPYFGNWIELIVGTSSTGKLSLGCTVKERIAEIAG